MSPLPLGRVVVSDFGAGDRPNPPSWATHSGWRPKVYQNRELGPGGNLKTVRAYLLKEAFQQLWDYNSPAWAAKFLDEWCRQTMRCRIEPMKQIARSLRQHRELILNYFRAGGLISSGVVEGLNNKAKVTTRKSYGFRTYRVLELALYH